MNNLEEANRRLKEAEACLDTAKKIFPLNDFRATVQNAQLCIELSAKAVISYFLEPQWTHDPSQQLIQVIEQQRSQLKENFGEEFLIRLSCLAEDAKQAGPWHAWSIYGREQEGRWFSAIQLCTNQIADDLLQRAERSLDTAKDFLERLKNIN